MANKISLAEAMKAKLAQKKEEQMAGGKQQKHEPSPNQQRMKSQITKRPNNQKKRTGV